MSMLAEPRRKQKISADPRNLAWKNDENKVGQKLMEKMGWSSGKGLGANESGKLDPIKVELKSNNRGVGCTRNYADNWIAHQDDFNSLLASLNTTSADSDDNVNCELQDKHVQRLEEKSKKSKGLVHYMKFAKGKDLSMKTESDLDCIFGRRKSKSAPSTQQSKSTANSDDDASKEEEVEQKIVTFTSGTSIQDYFAMKMAALKKVRSEGNQKLQHDDHNTTSGERSEEGPTESRLTSDELKNDETEGKNRKKKKKKHKKSKCNEQEEEFMLGKTQEGTGASNCIDHYGDLANGELVPVKKKKEKKRNRNEDAEITEELTENVAIVETTSKKKKKKKRKLDEDNACEDTLDKTESDLIKDNSNSVSGKKKKTSKNSRNHASIGQLQDSEDSERDHEVEKRNCTEQGNIAASTTCVQNKKQKRNQLDKATLDAIKKSYKTLKMKEKTEMKDAVVDFVGFNGSNFTEIKGYGHCFETSLTIEASSNNNIGAANDDDRKKRGK